MEAAASLKSWNQAFEDYPIAATRDIERQLRSSIVRDKDKLRALVGGNYRDLLATAEQIVTLDSQTKGTETQISSLRQTCKPVQYTARRSSGTLERQTLIAELSLLHKCLLVTASSLKDGAVLRTARLLVVARLLHRSLNDTETPLKSLETLFQRLTSLRRQLIRHINSRLADPRSKPLQLIEAACSYCLATSCSSTDAIKHFGNLRLEAIKQRISEVRKGFDGTKGTFSYFIKTLQTTKALLGRQLPEALAQIQKQPILRDPSITNIQALDLDSLVVLISPEIYNFTPYVKRSDAKNARHEAEALLSKWSEIAFHLVIEGLQRFLDTLHDVQAVLDLRTHLLSAWVAVCFSVPAHSGVLDALRHTLNDKLKALIEHQSATFLDISDALVKPPLQNINPLSIWDAEFVSMSVSKGASTFQKQLRARHLGLLGPLRSNTKTLSNWTSSIQVTQSHIWDIQRIRWQDKVEEAEEDDEETTAVIIKSLAEEDPRFFSTYLNNSLANSVSEFQQRIKKATEDIDRGETSYTSALYMLRAIREIEQRLETNFDQINLSELQHMAPILHRKVAEEVAKRLSIAIEKEKKSPATLSQSTLTPLDLPSPSAFRALRQLCSIMADLGGIDIWTEPVVAVVKEAIKTRIFAEEHKFFYAKSGFDEIYLKAALSTKADAEVRVASGESQEQAKAVEYWSRTKLLFGLLA